LVAAAIARTGPTAPTSVSVNYRVERTNGINFGKALIDCATQRLWQGAIGPRASVSSPLPCPRPAGWTPAGPVLACTLGPNAAALSPTFRVARGGLLLPRPCRASRVRIAVRSVLTSFDGGLGEAFAARFAPRGRLRAYAGGDVVGRRTLTRFARTRYEAGDGWTARYLTPPTAARAGRAVYRLRLTVSYQGEVMSRRAAATLGIDCRSGRVRSWVGPAGRTPGT
jgi:hypothetical protein